MKELKQANPAKAAWADENGLKWVRLQQQTDEQLAPLGLPAIDALQLQSGERVLDVGCGGGQTLMQLVERVAESGWVTGLDISAPLVNLARERVKGAGCKNVDVVLGDAEHVQLERQYDALYSRFGVMFFDHSEAAFSHLARQLRPGGRLSFVCWQAMDRNPWATLPIAALQSVVPELSLPELLMPDQPGPFRFGDGAVVKHVLAAAGFDCAKILPQETQMSFGAAKNVAAAVQYAQEIGPSARLIQKLDPALLPRVREALKDVFEPALGPNGIRMLASTFVVTAERR